MIKFIDFSFKSSPLIREITENNYYIFYGKCRYLIKIIIFLDSKKRNKKLWKLAADRGLDETLKTDWSEIVGEEPVEIAKRLRFDGRKWSEDKIKLRIQKKPFANGTKILRQLLNVLRRDERVLQSPEAR